MDNRDEAELPQHGSIYRTLGGGSPWNRIGCGILDKSGSTLDFSDYRAPTWSMVLVLRGRGTYVDDTQHPTALAAGDCFVRLPGRIHSTRLDPDSRWLEAFIDCGPDLWRALSAMQVLRTEPAVWHWGLTSERITRFSLLRTDLERAGERLLPALCMRVLSLAVDAQPVDAALGGDDVIERACQALTEEADGRPDLAGWCRRRGIPYERFRKDFQRRMGVSPGQYRIRRRLDRACALLHSTERTLADIAAELGYCSPYEFSAQFRAHMGVAPSRYRAR